MLKPTQLLAFAEERVTADDIGTAVFEVQQNIEAVEADTRDQNGGDQD